MPRRRRIAAIAVVTATALALSSCSAVPRRPRAVSADHVTTSVPLSAHGDRGPAPGGLRLVGSVDTPVEGGTPVGTGHSVVDGQLFVATPRGLVAHDAGTGSERWHYREPGRALAAYAVTGGVAVVMTGVPRTGVTVPDRWTALDATTGALLWARAVRGVPLPLAFDSPRAGMGGVVPVAADGRVRGVEARTGRVRWTSGPVGTPDCRSTYAAGDDVLTLVTAVCRKAVRFLAVDPASGRERWRRAIPSNANTLLSSPVRRGLTLLGVGDERVLVTADGRELLRAGRSRFCKDRCEMAVGDGHAVLADFKHLHTVDLRTGELRTRPTNSPYDALTVAGGRFYGLRRTLAAPLLPAALDVVDPRDGTVTATPMPFTTGPGSLTDSQVEAVWVTGERVFVTELYQDGEAGEKGLMTSAVAAVPAGGGPPELGGVPPGAWPDACGLAPGYRRAGPGLDVRLGGRTLRRVRCSVRGAADPLPVQVTVLWVARSAGEADDFLPEGEQVPAVGDEVVETDEPDRRVVMRSGRYLVAFDARLPRSAPLARAIHDRLRDH
ncbi:PQQ-binding-like beta-propeller repeat protein [Actinomadura kijaniata]|uniref:PQQ-like beta-propeller repeat protein n=1 Tax=Actinomadura kijaniata TaxID=46161 RepID=UPI003F1D2902